MNWRENVLGWLERTMYMYGAAFRDRISKGDIYGFDYVIWFGILIQFTILFAIYLSIQMSDIRGRV